MILFADFLKSSKDLKPRKKYRIDDSIYEKCASDNIDNLWLGVRFSPQNIVYSATSLSESKRMYDKFEYVSEAELKTFPTDKFSRVLMQNIAKLCGFQTMKIGRTLTDEYLVLDGSKVFFSDVVQDGKLDSDCFIDVKYSYVENDIAGRVLYRLFIDGKFDTDDMTKKIKNGLSSLIKAADYCGYNYISHQLYDYLHDQFIPELIFESKFQTTKIKISDKLYHIAPLSLKDKILRGGIAPKSKSAIRNSMVCHPDRVYMFNFYDEHMFESFCRQSRKKSFGYSHQMGLGYFKYEYGIFEIDRSKIPNLKLFRDNNYESRDDDNPTALYSYSNIPPSAIRFIKSFNLDKK